MRRRSPRRFRARMPPSCSGGTPPISGRAPADAFADSAAFSMEAVVPIAWAAANGIFRGTAARTFAPRAALTRAQAATLLTRLAAAAG